MMREDVNHTHNSGAKPLLNERGAAGRAMPQKRLDREINLSFGQLIVAWSVTAGMMVAVFLFGLYTGREQGLKQAMEEKGQADLRLPITGLAQTGGDSGQAARDLNTQAMLTASLSPQAVASNKETAQEADFSALAKATEKRNLVDDSQLGFSGKAAALPNLGDAATKGKTLAAEAPRGADAARARLTEDGKITETQATIRQEDTGTDDQADGVALSIKQLEAKVRDGEVPLRSSEKTSSSSLAREVKDTKSKDITPLRLVSELNPGWYIQVYAANSKKEAQELSGKLGKIGLGAKTKVQLAKVNKAQYFRVMVGPFKNQSEAQTNQKKISSNRIARGTPFVRRIVE